MYPSPNAIYPSLQLPGKRSRSINISQTKVQSQKCTWLDRAERNFPFPHPHSAAAVPGIHFFNPVPHESLNSHLSWARQGWGLGAGTERRTIQLNRLLKDLFCFHSLNVNNKRESRGAHRISEIIPFPVVLLQNTKLICFPRRVLFGWAFLQPHKPKG